MIVNLARLVLPALIPSWRFFDRIGPAPIVRVSTTAEPLHWRQIPPRVATRRPAELIASLFHNPSRNEALYVQSLAERLITQDDAHAARELRDFAAKAVSGAAFFLSVVVRVPGAGSEEEVYRSGPHSEPGSGA